MPFFKEGEPEDRFFSRDTGLLCRQFQKAGHESWVVLLDGPDVQQHPDIIRVSLEKMESADWWAQFEPDAVVLYAWMLPRYVKITQAIKASGARLISRCDSTGLYDPRIDSFEYMRQEFYGYGSSVLTKNNVQRAVRFVVKAGYRFLNRSYQYGVIAFAEACDEMLIESTLAKERMNRFFQMYKRPNLAERVRCVPHPIDVNSPSGEVHKEKLIIAVGRWDDYIKNGPLLMRVLIRALRDLKDYRAAVIGTGSEPLQRMAEKSGVADRIHFTGRLPHVEVQDWMHKAQIMLITSRYESFNMAAAEALSQGASVVGSSHLPSIRDFVFRDSGSMARGYNSTALVMALESEIFMWLDGQRDPVNISKTWRKQVSAGVVVELLSKPSCMT